MADIQTEAITYTTAIPEGRWDSSMYRDNYNSKSMFRNPTPAVGTEHIGSSNVRTLGDYGKENQRLIDTWSDKFGNSPKNAWKFIIDTLGVDERALCATASTPFLGAGNIKKLLDSAPRDKLEELFKAAYAIGGGTQEFNEATVNFDVGDLTYDKKRADKNTTGLPKGASKVVEAIISYDKRYGDTLRDLDKTYSEMGKRKNANMYKAVGDDGTVGKGTAPDDLAKYIYYYGKLQYLYDATGMRYTGRKDWDAINWADPKLGVSDETREYFEELVDKYKEARSKHEKGFHALNNLKTTDYDKYVATTHAYYIMNPRAWTSDKAWAEMEKVADSFDPARKKDLNKAVDKAHDMARTGVDVVEVQDTDTTNSDVRMKEPISKGAIAGMGLVRSLINNIQFNNK